MTDVRNNRTGDVLVAETKDVRAFARLLRGIGLKHHAVMTISRAGFEVTVEEVKTLCAWIPINLFDVFTFRPHSQGNNGNIEDEDDEDPTPECFEISLDALLQCLNIFGNAGPSASTPTLGRSKRRWAGEGDNNNAAGGDDDADDWRVGPGKKGRTGMRMTWGGPGHDLEILLKDDNKGPMTKCSLKTMEPEELMNQVFDSDNTALYLIMKSEWFRDALLDLPPTCSQIVITATPRGSDTPAAIPDATGSSNARRYHRAEVGNFQIRATGDFGTAELDYPNDKELMDKFDCAGGVCYSRALQQSVKIAIRIEHGGFLCVQIMMPVAEGVPLGDHSGILEFKVGKHLENVDKVLITQMHALEEDDIVE